MNKNIVLKFIIICVTLSSCAQKQGEDSIRLISDGYTGPILIIFDQENGQPKEYEGEKRVYRIPENGVLRTQFETNYGIQDHQFFYVNREGGRFKITYVVLKKSGSSSKVNDSLKVFAYREQALGEVRNFDPNTGGLLSIQPPARSFYIGSLIETEMTAREQMKFVFKYINSNN